jgi:Family of unknown function (DUF5752)
LQAKPRWWRDEVLKPEAQLRIQRLLTAVTEARRSLLLLEKLSISVRPTLVMPTSFQAHTLPEFAEGIRGVSVHSIHHHFIEARLRIKLMSNDFSQWLHEDVGLTEPARALNRIDIYTATLDGVREQIGGRAS